MTLDCLVVNQINNIKQPIFICREHNVDAIHIISANMYNDK